MSSHIDGVLKHFNYDHLTPGALRDTSRLFHDLAHTLAERLPASADTTIALRELLAAKDNAVRSMLSVTPADEQAPRVSDEELAGEPDEPQLEGLQARYHVLTTDNRTLTAYAVAERSDGEEGTDVTFTDGITVSFGPGEITDIQRMVP